MNNIHFEQVNQAILALIDTKSDKQLTTQIVEIAIKLINADFGTLFLSNKDRIKKIYYSDERVKKNVLLQNKYVTHLLSKNKLCYLTQKELTNKKIGDFPKEITFVILVPLRHIQYKQTLGFLILYFHKEKTHITVTEKKLLTLYSHYAVLALTKSKLQEESLKALELRDRFVSLASHELRTPLTSIHGYVQLLYDRMKNNDTIESRWIKELYIESIRMTQLVKELLDVNRIKQGQFAFVFGEVPMQEIVTRAIDRYRLTNANHPFHFQSKLTNKETMVIGDFDKLVEMVSGLLGNAVKFSKPGEEIILILKYNRGMILLEVKDTGKGISKQDLDTILNGFYKSNHASHIEGMGVGLLLAKHIIDNHRGKLKITSKENKGTSVLVSLPSIKRQITIP
ncbi:MAG TPA: HAMP domain-containing sensor histidine kinase [Candidatus Sulfotelmatobacter sp.]|jgi:signal transduction histidine kinase|nr:HAMP domain-containing sensor histidine kinase [Candidatus Sulfotelmatobacter sp.]